MTENFDSYGCTLKLILIVVLLGITVGFVIGGLLIDSFEDKKYHKECNDYQIECKNYHPNCGTEMDSILIYNYWNKP